MDREAIQKQFIYVFICVYVSQVMLVVKNLPVNEGRQETGVRSLGQEDPLKEGMATHSSIPAWRIPWTEVPGGLPSN